MYYIWYIIEDIRTLLKMNWLSSEIQPLSGAASRLSIGSTGFALLLTPTCHSLRFARLWLCDPYRRIEPLRRMLAACPGRLCLPEGAGIIVQGSLDKISIYFPFHSCPFVWRKQGFSSCLFLLRQVVIEWTSKPQDSVFLMLEWIQLERRL